jgi:hypothetical protein
LNVNAGPAACAEKGPWFVTRAIHETAHDPAMPPRHGPPAHRRARQPGHARPAAVQAKPAAQGVDFASWTIGADGGFHDGPAVLHASFPDPVDVFCFRLDPPADR